MNILLRGGGFVNKGAEAMLATAMEELARRTGGEAAFFIEPDFLSKGNAHHLQNHDQLRKAPNRYLGKGQKALVLGRAVWRSSEGMRRVMRERGAFTAAAALLSDMDAVIDVSGYAYGMPWGRKRAMQNVRYMEIADGRVPYIFLPQAWGPFDSAGERERQVYRRMVELSALTYVRDQESRKAVTALLQGEPDHVLTAPDIAFLYEGKPPTDEISLELGRMLDWMGENLDVVGLAPNLKVYERAHGTGSRNAYVQVLWEIIQTLIDRGWRVGLIPHEICDTGLGGYDDRLLCDLAAAGFPRERVQCATELVKAAEIKRVIAGTQCLVGSRFHALVGALERGKPVMALGWSHKYVELLRDFGLEEYVCQVSDLKNTKGIHAKLNLLLDRLDEAQTLVANALPGIKGHGTRVFDTVMDAIAGKTKA